MIYSGIYLNYEGSLDNCNSVQQNRETVFVTESGALRYKDISGNYWYYMDQEYIDNISGSLQTDIDNNTTYITNTSGQLNTRINDSGAYSANVSGILSTYITNVSGLSKSYTDTASGALNTKFNSYLPITSGLVNSNLGNLGTSSYLAKFGATGLADSVIYNDGSYVGINKVPSIGAVLDIQADRAGYMFVKIDNASSSANATAHFVATTDGGKSIKLATYSAAFTTTKYASKSHLYSSSTIGMIIEQHQSYPIDFHTNSLQRLRIAGDGQVYFSGVVHGITPTEDTHLTTKLYVDTASGALNTYITNSSGLLYDYITLSLNSVIAIQGSWDASGNLPDLSGVTDSGYAWRVTVSGTTNLSGINSWSVGDLAVKIPESWMKISNEDISAIWGNIGGTLSDQTDLQNALNAKASNTYVDNVSGLSKTYTDTASGALNTKFNSYLPISSGLVNSNLGNLGTSGTIAKFGATGLTDSVITEASNNLLIPTTSKFQFRDTALYISSKNDGYLDFDADTGFRFNTNLFVIGPLGVGTTGGYFINSVLQLASPVSFTNIAVGNSVLDSVSLIGANNTGVGYASLHGLTTGNFNVAVGDHALNELTTGSHNIGIGYMAGDECTEGISNIYIGQFATASAVDVTQEIAIGYSALGQGSHTVTIGNILTGNNYFYGSLTLSPQINTTSDTIFTVTGYEAKDAIIDFKSDEGDDAADTFRFRTVYNATSSSNVFKIQNDTSVKGTFVDRLSLTPSGILKVGDCATNYMQFAANGDQTFVGTAGFYPRVLTSCGEPAPGTGATQIDAGELCMWIDDDPPNQLYLCYNQGGTVKTVELT